MYNGANIAGEADPRLEREENGHDFLAPQRGVGAHCHVFYAE
jgi:hypothetical protein